MVSQSKRIWKCGATTQYNKIGYDPIYSTHFVVVGVGFAFVACSDGCGSLDVGDGVIEAGATVGGGAQAGVCYYIYVGDSN